MMDHFNIPEDLQPSRENIVRFIILVLFLQVELDMADSST